MNADHLAPFYEFLEHISFGRSLDGRFLVSLLSANPAVEVDYLDLSQKMADLAESRVARLDRQSRKRVRFFVADIRQFGPRPDGYDLIATHFFLDCFSDAQLSAIVPRIAAWTTPSVLWLLSEFREARESHRRLWTHSIIRSLYAAFRLTTGLQVQHLPDYSAAIARAGFSLRDQQISLAGLLSSSLWVNRVPRD